MSRMIHETSQALGPRDILQIMLGRELGALSGAGEKVLSLGRGAKLW